MHTNSKSNTNSSPAQKTSPAATPNTKSHDKDTDKSLIAKIDTLKKRELELEHALEVTRNGNSLLEKEAEDLEQYQCRTCIIVDGIIPPKNGTEEQITTKTKTLLIKKCRF